MRPFLLALLGIVLLAVPASAFTVQEITSPGGITAWLVETHNIPLITMDFAFDGGAALDPPGKEGTAEFLTGMMDEGAADMDGQTFREKRDRLSMNLRFSADTDNFSGRLSTLSKNRDAAFALMKAAVTAPRFAHEPMERMRQNFIQSVQQDNRDQNSIAFRNWLALAFPNHTYGKLTSGTEQSIAAITPEDLQRFHKTVFSRNGMRIAVVGDIDAITLGQKLDEVFASLPATPVPHPVKPVEVAQGPLLKLVDFDAPQTAIVFGGKGIKDNDPSEYPAYVMFEILGGQASFARLTQQVREMRGLTYGISYSNQSLPLAGFSVGFFTTANETAGQALQVVKDELRKMAETGPSEAELKIAKTYLTGSYPLRFDSNSAISGNLLGIQLRSLPATHIQTRNDRINAVTLDQVKQQARNLLEPDKLIVSIVGKPVGIK